MKEVLNYIYRKCLADGCFLSIKTACTPFVYGFYYNTLPSPTQRHQEIYHNFVIPFFSCCGSHILEPLSSRSFPWGGGCEVKFSKTLDDKTEPRTRKRRPCKQRPRKHRRVTNTKTAFARERNEFKSLSSSFLFLFEVCVFEVCVFRGLRFRDTQNKGNGLGFWDRFNI